jgi:hypothetical protein
MSKFLILKRLCFTGPDREDACLDFHEGLNIIYGASDSGKSFILEALSFMLGGGAQLRDIPERVGYDRIWLSMVRPDGTIFTITRSTNGGDYNLYEGILKSEPVDISPAVLRNKHDAKKSDNLSTYLLGLIGATSKKLKSKANGTTVSFTASHLRHLCVVSETDIQKQESPILGGQVISATAEMAAFKFLLTGVDDSGLIKSAADSPASQSRQAKREMLEELLLSYQERLDKLAEHPVLGDELAEQLHKLDQTLSHEAGLLQSSEADYAGISESRFALRQSIERSLERQGEIEDLLARFELLIEHYSSDIRRLEGIQEAGSLVAALSPGQCPLCGFEGPRPHPETFCDGNLDIVVAAASAEREKIVLLRYDLEKTIAKLKGEARSFERLLPKLRLELSELDSKVAEITPSIADRRSSYQSLMEQWASIRSMHDLWEEIGDLRQRWTKLEDVPKVVAGDIPYTSELPASVIDAFSQMLEMTLQAWRFPNANRVHFDSQKKDFNIAGKLRGSRGKGMRAITHAAFTVTLLEFCRQKALPHFGFVIMDTPLLAYREPDAADEGISETGLNEHFYTYLSRLKGSQILVIENVDPPGNFAEQTYSTRFTGNQEVGRAGFFPEPV